MSIPTWMKFWLSEDEKDLEREIRAMERQFASGEFSFGKRSSWWSGLDFGQKFVLFLVPIILILTFNAFRSGTSLIADCKGGILRDCSEWMMEFPLIQPSVRVQREVIAVEWADLQQYEIATPSPIVLTQTPVPTQTQTQTQTQTPAPTQTPLPTVAPTEVPISIIDCPGRIASSHIAEKCVEQNGLEFVVLHNIEGQTWVDKVMFIIPYVHSWPIGMNVGFAEVCSQTYDVTFDDPCIPLDDK